MSGVASPPKPLLLVADDDHDSADQLALLLRTALRCDVATAYNGATRWRRPWHGRLWR